MDGASLTTKSAKQKPEFEEENNAMKLFVWHHAKKVMTEKNRRIFFPICRRYLRGADKREKKEKKKLEHKKSKSCEFLAEEGGMTPPATFPANE